jgi:hypothetical protein
MPTVASKSLQLRGELFSVESPELGEPGNEPRHVELPDYHIEQQSSAAGQDRVEGAVLAVKGLTKKNACLRARSARFGYNRSTKVLHESP